MFKMRKSELEIELEKVPAIAKPKSKLEQYSISSDVAAQLCIEAQMRGAIEDKKVADLGCGTGKLCYASLLLGARECLCIDIDIQSLSLAKGFLPDSSRFLLADVNFLPLRKVDTVLMNPPFGVKKRGIDFKFLEAAMTVSENIFSVHLYSEGFQRLILKRIKGKYALSLIRREKMNIGKVMHYHRKRVHWIDVVLIGLKKIK